MKSKITQGNWLTIALVIGIFFALNIFSKNDNANVNTQSSSTPTQRTRNYDQVKESSLKYYAKVLAKRVVLHNLKAPKSADFGPIDSDLSGGHSDIVVTGYVDAQNTYGADIRTRFKITLWFNGDYEDEAYDDTKWILQDQQYDPH